MDKDEKPIRTIEVIADTVGDTVTAAVTTALAMAAATGNADLGFLAVPIGAMTDALGKQGATLVINTLRDRADRVALLLDEITAQTGALFDDFVDEHVDTDPKRRLLGSTVADATDATSAWKIKTPGMTPEASTAMCVYQAAPLTSAESAPSTAAGVTVVGNSPTLAAVVVRACRESADRRTAPP